MNTIEYLALVTGILSIGWKLDDALPEEAKNHLKRAIYRAYPPGEGYYETIHTVFRDVFDYIYQHFRSPNVERLTWLAIVGSYATMVSGRFTMWIFDINVRSTLLLLLGTITIAAAAVLLAYGLFRSRWILNQSVLLAQWIRIPDNRYLSRSINAAIVVTAGTIITLILGYVTIYFPWNGILLSILSIVFGLSVLLGGGFTLSFTQPIVKPKSGRLQVFLCIGASIMSIGLFTASIVAIVTVIGEEIHVILTMGIAILLLFLTAPLWLRFHSQLSSVNPLISMMISLGIIIVLAWFFPHPRHAFIQKLGQTGPLILLYLLFNLFADSISLVETNIILRKARNQNPVRLVFYLIFDLTISSLVFLILPLLVSQSPNILLQGIQFAGPQPWIGLLFWTTFSTSALFYIFVIAVAAAQIWRFPGKFIRFSWEWLQLDNKPFSYVSLLLSLVIIIIWIISKIQNTFSLS